MFLCVRVSVGVGIMMWVWGWMREVYGGQGSPYTLEVDFECDKGKVYGTALHDFSPAIQAAAFCLYRYLLRICKEHLR